MNLPIYRKCSNSLFVRIRMPEKQKQKRLDCTEATHSNETQLLTAQVTRELLLRVKQEGIVTCLFTLLRQQITREVRITGNGRRARA